MTVNWKRSSARKWRDSFRSEYFGQYRGIGRYEMELPEKGAYLLSGLADIVHDNPEGKNGGFLC